MNQVDVVIPVYDGFAATQACIEAVLATCDPAWARLVLINDASPDPDIASLLRGIAAHHAHVVLLENETNQGFVITANRGMQHDLQRDVLLLNSDVVVANDWLHRLRQASCQHTDAASLTPFSNNATICSFPDICEENALLFDLSVAEIDAYFAEQFGVEDVYTVPTGVGCCMYLRREALNEVGYFDADTFGKGYGEENDWCQRAERGGWKNLHVSNCFVYHEGGVSFGSSTDGRVAEALRLLAAKHPQYDIAVQDYIARDPARAARVSSMLGLLARQDKPKLLLVAHKLGGGAQQHVDELAGFFARDALFLQLTPHEDGQSVTLTCFNQGRKIKDGLFFDVASEYPRLVRLLRELGVAHVHFHHTMGLHPRVWKLAEDLDCRYDLTIHDYYLINGNPTLTDSKARYADVEQDNFDERCAGHYPLPPDVTAAQWREGQLPLVQNASRVIFPSIDCRQRFQRFFVVPNPVVAWHPDYLLSQPYPPPRWHYDGSRPLRVLVMGALSREKGADVLEAVASTLQNAPVEFHLLGYAYQALAAGVITHGPYNNAEVKQHIDRIEPDIVWFPALWPETYSYTLSIAMHAGLPVVVPSIGAFVERVRGRPLSAVRDWDSPVETWRSFWQHVIETRAFPDSGSSACAEAVAAPGDNEFYRSQYLQPVPSLQSQLTAETAASLQRHYHADGAALSFPERVLKRVWLLSRQPVVSSLVSVIPFRARQSIKRRLSTRPMHDIVRK